MYTQQDRASVGSKLKPNHRNSCAKMATMLRLLMQMPSYRKDETFDTDVLGDLADQLDQIAMPIVVEAQMTTISPVPEQDFIDASIGLAIRAALPSHRHLFCLASGPQGERGFVCTRMYSHAGNHECIRPKTAENSAIVLARWK